MTDQLSKRCDRWCQKLMKGGKGRENIFCKPTASMRYSHGCAVEQFQSTGIGRLVKKIQQH